MTKAQIVFCRIVLMLTVATLALSCKQKPETVIVAKYESALDNKFILELFSNSTYTTKEEYIDDTIVRKGTYKIINDTLIFSYSLIPVKSKVAVIKNKVLEFNNTTMRLEIINNVQFPHRNGEQKRYTDYYIFTYSHKLYPYIFETSAKPYNLSEEDIAGLDEIFSSCIVDYLNTIASTYNKQCVAVINQKGEKEVWVNCICKKDVDSNVKYNIVRVKDGGSCFLNLKINLTTGKCSDVYINGEA